MARGEHYRRLRFGEAQCLRSADQDLLTVGLARCPVPEKTEHLPGVPPAIWQMWPVRAPDQAIGPRCDECPAQRFHRGQCLVANDPVGAGQLDVAYPPARTPTRRSKSAELSPSDLPRTVARQRTKRTARPAHCPTSRKTRDQSLETLGTACASLSFSRARFAGTLGHRHGVLGMASWSDVADVVGCRWVLRSSHDSAILAR
jgi:hypothetical protein